MKICATYKLNQAIRHHQRMRDMLVYIQDHGMCLGSPNHQVYVDEIRHKANCERRCIERLQRLLNRYYDKMS